MKAIYAAIGAFLDKHRLDASPSNYALAHALLTRSNAEAIAEVEKITGDGLRLTQEEADRILLLIGQTVAEQPRTLDAEVSELNRIVERTRAETESYGRDLQTRADALAAAGTSVSLTDLMHVSAALLERTRAAERALESATSETLALRRKLADANQQANVDSLTELPNRRAFEAEYDALVGAGSNVALAICDIDHFKRINDTHGHPVGDRVLKRVAQSLKTSCDPHLVARLGGEEFVILFANTPITKAGHILDEARASVASHSYRVRESDQPLGTVTFSAGLAAAALGEPRETALGRADALLYQAKRGGRNRVECEAI